MQALACLPVCNNDGEVIGVAQVTNKRGDHGGVAAFTDADVRVLRRYLTFCGIGIQNAQLFEMSLLEYKKNRVKQYFFITQTCLLCFLLN